MPRSRISRCMGVCYRAPTNGTWPRSRCVARPVNSPPLPDVTDRPLMRFALPLLATLFLAAALPRAAQAEGPGTAAVRKANDQVTTLLKRKVTPGSPEEKKLAGEITGKLREFLDIEEMGKRALVDHWAKLSPAEQTEFSKL